MAYELSFSDCYKYDSQQQGIEIPAVLRAGGNGIRVLAKIDTGATYCLFERWVAEELGLQVEKGHRQPFVTANSRLTRSAVLNRSRFDSSNRFSSCFVRTKARMTRTPASVSREKR